MKRNVLVLAVLFALFLSFAAVPAFATDGKIYPGAMGVRWNANEPVPALNFSALGNPSATQWLRMDLPVIHDSINYSINSGWVKVIDMHYSQNIRCSLNSIYRNGCTWYGWGSGNVYSSGSSCNAQTLTFGSVGSNSQSHYYYSCSIPPTYSGNQSYIISYYVSENN